MRATLLSIALAATMHPAAAGAPAELETRIKDIYDRHLYDAANPNVTWSADGASYTQQQPGEGGGPVVTRCQVESGTCRQIAAMRDIYQAMHAAEPGLQSVNGFAVSPGDRWALTGGNMTVADDGTRKIDLFLIDLKNKSVKKIVQGSTYSDARTAFSPNDRWILFGRNGNLFTYDIANGTTRQLTKDGVADTIFNGGFVTWSPDGAAIAFVQTDTRRVRQYPLVDNTAADYPKVRNQPYPMVGTPFPVLRLALVRAAGDAPLRWVELQTRETDSGILPPRWTRDGKGLVVEVLSRAKDVATLLLADAATGKSRVLRRDQSNTWVRDTQFAPSAGFSWIEENGAFVWLNENDGWRRAYRVAGDSATPLTPANVDVMGTPKVDAVAGWLYYTASPGNATERYLYRVALDGSLNAERLTPADQPGTHSYDFSPNGKWAFHIYSTADTPPVTDIIELPSHRVVRTLGDNARLKERLATWGPRPTEFFTLNIGNGVSMDAWMLKPRDFDPRKKYPVFVFVYGEPASQAVVNAWSNGQGNGVFHRAIADAGYLVVAMDNRGTPAAKGTAWRRAVFGSLGPLSTDEQAAGLAELGRMRPYVDLSRVGIWGWSAGGTNTLNALFRKPDQYHVGIAVAAKPRPELYNGPFQETYMRTPAVNPEGYRTAAPYNYAEGLKGDLLIIHGTGEDNTHLAIIEHLVNRLIELGKPFDYMTYPGRSHGLNEGPGTTLHLRLLIARYLTEHLPPGGH